jgi:hypothetical protein
VNPSWAELPRLAGFDAAVRIPVALQKKCELGNILGGLAPWHGTIQFWAIRQVESSDNSQGKIKDSGHYLNLNQGVILWYNSLFSKVLQIAKYA